ncbi:4154_t:CDS:2 [Dentiscutata heterogama]|uniref:4154_t:CDS:1 n=1 Tax=Dentiscutata heterogama TaxID=1316150 RepID=A0ACA9LV28_9GLOM|nr:4154_t:CDS:2 [Dentiscutata heterogama]
MKFSQLFFVTLGLLAFINSFVSAAGVFDLKATPGSSGILEVNWTKNDAIAQQINETQPSSGDPPAAESTGSSDPPVATSTGSPSLNAAATPNPQANTTAQTNTTASPSVPQANTTASTPVPSTQPSTPPVKRENSVSKSKSKSKSNDNWRNDKSRNRNNNKFDLLVVITCESIGFYDSVFGRYNDGKLSYNLYGPAIIRGVKILNPTVIVGAIVKAIVEAIVEAIVGTIQLYVLF